MQGKSTGTSKSEVQKKPKNGVNLDSKIGLVSETERDGQCK